MFEKEAKERAKDIYIHHFDDDVNYPDVLKAITVGIQKGAEHGYNKANEWHYVKDGDLPTKELEGKQLLVRIRNYTENFILAYYMLDLYYSKNGKRFYSDTDCNYPIDIGNVIAWKEIVFPKEMKEK